MEMHAIWINLFHQVRFTLLIITLYFSIILILLMTMFSPAHASSAVCAEWNAGAAGCFTSFQTAMEAACADNNPDSTSIPGYLYYRDSCVITSIPNFTVYAHRVTLATGDSLSFTYAASLAQCDCPIPPLSFTLTLSGGTSTEPGKNLRFTATVKNQDGSAPSEPVTVNLSLKVEPKSGGHEHGDSTRPRGKLSGKACLSDSTCLPITTNGTGVASFSFDAPDASGTHTITATCDKCSDSPKTAEVKVKIEGLEQIPATPLFYTMSEADGSVIGAVQGKHTDNHYLTPEAASVLWRMAASYRFEQRFKVLNPITKKLVAPPVLHLNDASLVWGGKFDIPGTWRGSHYEHDKGIVIDIRANTAAGYIPEAHFTDFENMADGIGADAQLHCSLTRDPSIDNCAGDTNRHYHVILN